MPSSSSFCLPLLALLLVGCADGGPLATAPPASRTASAFDCPASAGAPRVELCDGSLEHRPVADGVTYLVRRMPQGFTVIQTPVWFGGLPGGDVLARLELTFTADGGEVIAERSNRSWMLPCDDADNVAADWLDTILPPGTQPGEYDGAQGDLVVQIELEDGTVLTDEVRARLEHGDD